MFDFSQLNITLAGLQQHYRNQDFSPAELVAFLQQQYAKHTDNPIWIYPLSEIEVAPYLDALANCSVDTAPLYGVPFAIKDNIDLAGIPTTAACPDYAYIPDQSAFVVQKLIAAGAIPMGKTNLDQFATGLVGVRSPEPWGPCKNAFNEDYIAGGSSSGSAVAVAKGWVSFALGTDTAGSGRVPAAFNNVVGLKPSRGLLSTRGVVPACRSLDCVSIFALTSADANRIFDCAAQFDLQDDFARTNPFSNGARYFSPEPAPFTLGVPATDQLEFFGDPEAERLFNDAVAKLVTAGIQFKEIDFTPFKQAALLLYEGPWVAERYLATLPMIEDSPQSMLPVIQSIIGAGNRASALDGFKAQYQLQHYRQRAEQELAKVDAIITPTTGTCFTIAEVLADPIKLNSQLGYYTNFMNLLDCCAVATPTSFFGHGAGFGITLFHQAMRDKQLLSMASKIERLFQRPLGATQIEPTATQVTSRPPYQTVDVVVCGAHLDGLPLNWQLQERGAVLLENSESSSHYQLYALAGGPPFRPGMVRVDEGGQPIKVQVWRLPKTEFGSFVAEIPAPLGIGKVELSDGRWLSGFICEQSGLKGAENITEFSGWRAYIERKG